MKGKLDDRISEVLRIRKEQDEYRQLSKESDFEGKIDFASNDYLGLSRSAWIADRVATDTSTSSQNGSTGSRLLTGNSEEIEKLERKIADFHHGEAALLMSSGYAANEGLISTLCREGDVILFDEFSHASIRQGIRLSKATSFAFNHNDFEHLKKLLIEHQNKMIFVVVESVYSMDGDHAPLAQIAALKNELSFELIVDEAHALGVFGKQGRGLCDEVGITDDCLARVYTFGKAMGSHGAVIVGSINLKDYLINFCKPFIYSTAPDRRFIATVEHSYNYILKFEYQQNRLLYLICKFRSLFSNLKSFELRGEGPVFALLCSSAKQARMTAATLNDCGFNLRPIVYPTVPKGQERIRISLHSFNTEKEIDLLFECLQNYEQ